MGSSGEGPQGAASRLGERFLPFPFDCTGRVVILAGLLLSLKHVILSDIGLDQGFQTVFQEGLGPLQGEGDAG